MSIKKVRTLNFDPGLSKTGWSVTDIDIEKGALVVVRLGEIKPAATADRVDRKEEVERYSKRVVTLTVLRSEIIHLLDEFKPDFVVMEDIFFNRFRPAAFPALCMWQCTARLTVRDHAHKPITAIAPKMAKAAISGNGASGKINVQKAIFDNPKIKFKNDNLAFGLSEHCADSIAIGYTFMVSFLPMILPTMLSGGDVIAPALVEA